MSHRDSDSERPGVKWQEVWLWIEKVEWFLTIYFIQDKLICGQVQFSQVEQGRLTISHLDENKTIPTAIKV